MVLLKPVGSQQSAVSSQRILRIAVFILIAHCSLLVADVRAEEKSYRINVEGMHCKTCIYRVTKSLKKLKQVKDVDVNLDEGIATVKLLDGEDVTPETLEEAVKDSGYKPNGVKQISSEN